MPGRRRNPSPEIVQIDHERAVVVKAMIAAMREFGGPIITPERFGAEASSIILCMGIYVGQSEGRPMNTSKLAAYVGIPRTTVMRRLSELERDGIISRMGEGYALTLEFLDDPGRITNGKRAKRHLNDAVRRLSKSGT